MKSAGVSPDRLRRFLYQPPAGGLTVSLLAEQGLGSTLVVCSWTREECETAADPSAPGSLDLVQVVFDSAQDHCDSIGEAARFQLVWFGREGRSLKSCVHMAAPVDRPMRPGDATGDGVMSANRIVGELLAALTQKDKALNISIGVVLQAYERALMMQQKTLEAALGQVERLSVTAGTGAGKTSEEIEVELETQKLKQLAVLKLFEHGPAMLQAVLSKMGADDDGGAH